MGLKITINSKKTIVKNLLTMTSVYSCSKSWAVFKKGWETLVETLVEDYAIVMRRDPAASNWLEVLFLYPGPQAIIFYRIAHLLHNLGVLFPISLAF